MNAITRWRSYASCAWPRTTCVRWLCVLDGPGAGLLETGLRLTVAISHSAGRPGHTGVRGGPRDRRESARDVVFRRDGPGPWYSVSRARIGISCKMRGLEFRSIARAGASFGIEIASCPRATQAFLVQSGRLCALREGRGAPCLVAVLLWRNQPRPPEDGPETKEDDPIATQESQRAQSAWKPQQ